MYKFKGPLTRRFVAESKICVLPDENQSKIQNRRKMNEIMFVVRGKKTKKRLR